ncbi:xanthine dehydrogenase subunit E [Bacillus sp. AFS018417]|uniref:Xanthine dehydrogenase subunit E n=1 Tax=Bacillus rhizoplanae TaxID=2880966 RepID=A0ABM8YDQ7_9BACI|nr:MULTISPECIES: (2Fe-2S)-binding protein [Bacillus]PEZ05075.1 xanthine dehydrogenase subunit E [Bacillus sp. AFS018417]CAG9613813.1 putative xanthine dehydrogenase subunit E [Bacillus rhizoplanae]
MDVIIEVQFKVNDQSVNLGVPPLRRLNDILREDLEMTGTKISCGIGRCGACTVLMNGQMVNSCLVMAFQLNHVEIVTIEGLDGEEELDPIQKAFMEEGGFQCGYCTPGMILATKALLEKHPHPTQEQILEGLSGNLCRCTGYGGILRAVKSISNAISGA